MADRKITDLTALAAGSQATGDLLTIVDVSEAAATDKNKKITVESLFKGIPGNVGIGTSSPGAKLEVLGGAIRINSPAGGYYFDIERNSTDGALEFKGYQVGFSGFAWKTSDISDGSFGEKMRLTTGGRLGIGTTSPVTNLHVVGTSGSGAIQIGNGNSDTQYHYINLGGRFNTHNAWQIGRSPSGGVGPANGFYIYDLKNSQTRLAIDSSGQVGIGTTAPNSLLEIRGTSDGQNVLHLSNTAGSSDGDAENQLRVTCNGNTNWGNLDIQAYQTIFTQNGTERLRIDSSGRVLVGTSFEGDVDADNLTINDAGNCGITIRSGTSNAGNIYFSDATSGGGEYDGYITYNQPNRFMGFGIGQAERMRLAATGNLGIGTTSPAGKLTVASRFDLQNSDSTNDRSIFAFDTNNLEIETRNGTGIIFKTNQSERARITSSGRVGIGTSSPTQKLTVNNGSDNSDVAVFTGGDNNRGLKISTAVNGGVNDSTVVFNAQTSSTGQFTFETNGSEAMRIDKDGKILLACTSAAGDSDPGVKISQANNPWLRIVGNEVTGTNFFLSGYNTHSSNNGYRFYVMFNGGIANFSSNNSNLCDEREKKNIVSLDTKWDKVKSWELKKFHYNEDADTDDLRYGVIAQQVEEHCPEVLADWVKQTAKDAVLDDDGNVVTPAVPEVVRKGVKEQQMMWMAIKALQEAQTRIETLEASNADLLARVTALEAG